MSQIKQASLYRGIKVDAGINKSSGGHIQLVVQLLATECYDPETGEWVEDWQQYDEQFGSEITGYLMLFSKDTSKDAFMTAKQLQKAWGWDGTSLAELEKLEPEPFQFRVIEDEYDGKKRLKVNWVDAYDAEPGGTIQKLDESELKKLDAMYANTLRKLGGGPKPKAVPKTDKPEKPELPAAVKEKYEKTAARGKAAEARVAAAEAKTKKPKLPTKSAKPAIPPKPTPIATGQPVQTANVNPELAEALSITESLGLPETCSQEDAWATCWKHKKEDMTEVQLAEIWVKVSEDLGGEDALGENWATVRDIVLEQAV